MVPDRVHSFMRSMVIRKPLRTKNTFTEMTPPAAQPNPPWLAMMPRMETARIPSRAGMYVSWVPTPRGTPALCLMLIGPSGCDRQRR